MAVRLAVAFACALVAAFPASAATVDVHAGRVIDPDLGRVSSDQRIRIVDGRIASVTPWNASDGP
ncbi:MAG TPA: amidohydrolase family protein, partial [Sphingomicrobium sp.]